MTENTANREGGLDAPTRHPIDWKSADFWDAESLDKELERVFDICHGCRRCVSLCQAFPTLFDLVDESETFEVDGVSKDDYGKVVDQCYLCDLCYQTKCPYVPPHPFNLDFPHLMLRAKAVEFKQKKASLKRRVLANPARLGRMSTLPVVVNMVNKANSSSSGRRMVEKALGIHREATRPEFSRPRPQKRIASITGPAGDAPKVAVFATCFGNYNRPQIVEDLIAVLRHNDLHAELANINACCGMPKMELGDLEGVARAAQAILPELARLVDDGFLIVAPVPSCALMFRQEIPLLLPDEPLTAKVQAAIRDPFELLMERHKEGQLKTVFANSLGTVAYHAPCHQRVQNIGPKTRQVLELIPDTKIETIERCSGHDGTYGLRTETYELAVKIARPVAKRIDRAEPNHVTSDCPLAGDHLQHVRGASDHAPHPMTLLRRAYGI